MGELFAVLEKNLQRDRQKWKEEGIEEGIKEGIEAFVLDNMEEGISEERILQKLQKRFKLSEEKAKYYYDHFSSGEQIDFIN